MTIAKSRAEEAPKDEASQASVSERNGQDDKTKEAPATERRAVSPPNHTHITAEDGGDKDASSLYLPTHLDLPYEDGTFVKNFQEHPQSVLLTESIRPILNKLHPDKQYCIGQDSGIYWRLTEPPLRGAEAPDWFYVPNVPPLLDGDYRRSYVMWQETVAPLIAIEFVSGNGEEERDATSPITAEGMSSEEKAGKFWVYEQAIRIPYYAIYEVKKSSVEVYRKNGGGYKLYEPNERGHYEIPEMGVEIGIWQGEYMGQNLPWLRWWDKEGNLLPDGDERAKQATQRAEQATQRAEQEAQRAEQEAQRAEQLAAKLRELGIDPDEL